jgi:hypothetical protein
MVEKAFSNERFRKNLIGLSPEIGKHIPFALRSLISSLERERGR